MSGHLGLAAGALTRGEVDALAVRALGALGGPEVVELVCTPVVQGRWTVALRLAGVVHPAVDPAAVALALGVATALAGDGGAFGPEPWQDAAREAARRLATGDGGRVVRFPGQERLVGTVGVDDVPGMSAIDEVRGVAGTPAAGLDLVTRSFVRPEQTQGRLVLVVRPWSEREVAPFEVPVQVACCEAHPA